MASARAWSWALVSAPYGSMGARGLGGGGPAGLAGVGSPRPVPVGDAGRPARVVPVVPGTDARPALRGRLARHAQRAAGRVPVIAGAHARAVALRRRSRVVAPARLEVQLLPRVEGHVLRVHEAGQQTGDPSEI